MASAKDTLVGEINRNPNKRTLDVNLGPVNANQLAFALLAAGIKGYHHSWKYRGDDIVVTLTKK